MISNRDTRPSVNNSILNFCKNAHLVVVNRRGKIQLYPKYFDVFWLNYTRNQLGTTATNRYFLNIPRKGDT